MEENNINQQLYEHLKTQPSYRLQERINWLKTDAIGTEASSANLEYVMANNIIEDRSRAAEAEVGKRNWDAITATAFMGAMIGAAVYVCGMMAIKGHDDPRPINEKMGKRITNWWRNRRNPKTNVQQTHPVWNATDETRFDVNKAWQYEVEWESKEP